MPTVTRPIAPPSRRAARILLLLVPLAAAAFPAAAQPTALTLGRTVRATIAPGDTARYTVAMDSGAIARLVVTQTGADVRVRVLGPGGGAVAGASAGPEGEERLQFESRVTGTYQVQVLPVGRAAGAYAITLVAREPLSDDPRRLVDQLLALHDRRDGPGIAVQVWRGGRTLFAKAVGMADLTHGIPFTVTTPTNIGSTSKQFTAFSVLLLAADGKLSLDDDVRKHLPELPDLGKVVTIRHFLTHTSGYREVYNAASLEGRRLGDGDHVERDEFLALVRRQPALQNAPGAEFNYNNTGYGLAATIVERISGMPYDRFMQARVFGPLGMTRTRVRMGRDHVVPGRTVGYQRDSSGTWREIPDLGSSYGAGGIHATVGDLQRWAENVARPRVGTAAMFDAMRTPFTLTDGKSTGYGMGLFIDTQGRLKRIHHGGADISHRSMLAYYPEIDAGITVQSNDATFDAGGTAFRIAEAFFKAEMTAPRAVAAAFDPATYRAERFDALAGRYALDAAPAFVLTFTRSGDSLFTQATGQPRFPIFPTSDSTFALRVVEASVTFHRDAAGKATHVTLHQGGRDQRATRVEGEAEKPWAPTADELRAFTGRYFSEELETFYTVTLEDGKLRLTLRRMGPIDLRPGKADEFSGAAPGAAVAISFERDRSGRVIGLYAGNGRTRDVRFERVR